MKHLGSRAGAIALFIFVSAALRIFWQTTAGVFPAKSLFQATLGILIGIVCVMAHVWLNRAFLAWDGFSKSALGLGVRQLPWLFAGAAMAMPIVLGMATVLRLFVPFHWAVGESGWHDVAWQFSHLIGNAEEELIFRGYLLMTLRRSLGLPRALAITGLLFGLFHLPGMSGMAAVKMVCTTGAMSVVFAMAYVRTKSLWTAIGLHAFMNLLLHRILGMSGEQQGLFRIQFEKSWPASYDPGMVALFAVAATVTLVLWLWRGVSATPSDQISG